MQLGHHILCQRNLQLSERPISLSTIVIFVRMTPDTCHIKELFGKTHLILRNQDANLMRDIASLRLQMRHQHRPFQGHSYAPSRVYFDAIFFVNTTNYPVVFLLRTNKIDSICIRHEPRISQSFASEKAWAKNEEMVDWFAIQFPKIYAVYQQLGVM